MNNITKEKELEMLYEELRAYQQMTVEAREYFKDKITELVAKIKALEA